MLSPVEELLQFCDEAYNKRSWHGPNLRGSLRGITAEQAAWRPAKERHNIWEIALHAAYWKYVVRRRLLGQKRGSFPLKGSNWFPRPAAGFQWKDDLGLLDQVHQTLHSAIAGLTAKELQEVPAGSTVSNAMLVRGIAMHDVYHAGQIQLIKRMMSS